VPTRPATSKGGQGRNSAARPGSSTTAKAASNTYARALGQSVGLGDSDAKRTIKRQQQPNGSNLVFSPSGAKKEIDLKDSSRTDLTAKKFATTVEALPSEKSITRGWSNLTLEDRPGVSGQKTKKFSESVLNQKKSSVASSNNNNLRLSGVYRISATDKTSYQPKGMTLTPLNQKKKPTKFLQSSGARSSVLKPEPEVGAASDPEAKSTTQTSQLQQQVADPSAVQSTPTQHAPI